MAFTSAMRLHNGLACAIIMFVGRSRVISSSIEENFSAGIAIILLSASAHLVNDLLDLGADRANRPDRTLPSGRLSARDLRIAALWTWGSGLTIGVFFVSDWTLWWMFWAMAGPGYSLVAKGRGWLAPFWTATVIATCWLAGAIDGGLSLMDVPILGGIILFLLFRELVKTLEDSRGDLLAGYQGMSGTFPGTLGGVVLLGSILLLFVVWLALVGTGFVIKLASLVFLAGLMGAIWWLLNPNWRTPHLAATLLKVCAFAGATLIWSVTP